MPKSYSPYDANARCSQVTPEARHGETVTESYRGEPVAQIRADSEIESGKLEARNGNA